MENLTKNKIGLMVPCYMDLLYPESAYKTLKFLELLNFNVHFLYEQTCCGQPFFNSGETEKGNIFLEKFLQTIHEYNYVVVLAGSCTSMIKNHYMHFIDDPNLCKVIKNKVFELTEFLYDIYKFHKSNINLVKKQKVSILYSCHGLRELKLAKSEEIKMNQIPDKVKEILNKIQGLEIIDIEMWDECCGFGGTFSYYENELSIKMGKDLLKKFINKNIKNIIGYDLSCLTHLKTISDNFHWNMNFFYIGEFLYDSFTLIHY
jgi:L-lactate dehydrogenase complex protein LldE